jgi:hypothetical protein
VEGVVVVAARTRHRHPHVDIVDMEGVMDSAARAVLRHLIRCILYHPP